MSTTCYPSAPGPFGMTVHWEKIGPVRAAELLELNIRNRREKPSGIEKWARSMIEGLWQPVSVFVISKQKILLDGQNRLQAVIRTGTAQWFLIIEGADEAVQDTIDSGVKRGLSDALTLRGEHNASELAAAIGQLYVYQSVGYFGATSTGGGKGVTTPEGLLLLEETPGLRESVSATAATARLLKIGSGVAACAHYLFNELNAEDADFFFQRLRDGTVEPGHPVHTLRQDLLRDMSALRQMQPKRKAAIMVRAWNAFRDGEILTKLQWAPGGARPNAFPVPR